VEMRAGVGGAAGGECSMGLGRRRVVVREMGCIQNCIRTRTHTHTHWVINSIISSGVVSSSLGQMLSPALECERGTISMGKWKKRGWARGWGGNGVAVRGRTWFLTHTQRRMELCLLDPGVSLNLPNPHLRVEDDSEHNSGILFLFFMLSAFD
jgi:hypothetical protein